MNTRLIKFVAVFFAICLGVSLAFNWILSVAADAPTEITVDGIKSVRPYYSQDRLMLEISLSKDLTCREIISSLKIQPIKINNRMFFPVCELKKNRAVISYMQSDAA